MNRFTSFSLTVAMLLATTIPGLAGPCSASIDQLQARIDAAIDKRAGAGPWKPESLNATRSHQPTPGSIAAAEGSAGRKFDLALAALGRARSADDAGNLALCNRELHKARRALR